MYKEHAYLTFGGGIGPGEGFEEWASGLRFSVEDPLITAISPPVPAMREYLNDNIVPELIAWFKRTGTHISPAASLRWAKFNLIGPDGKYVESETILTELTPQRGSGGSDTTVMTFPAQVSLAVTLETGASRGYANRGRMFLPCPFVSLGANGLISTAQTQEVAESTKTFLNNVTDNVVSGLGSYSFAPAVESKLGNGGDGTERLVTGVSVDSRLDIQRSRAKSLRGVRISVDL